MFQHVPAGGGGPGPVPKQGVAAPAQGIVRVPGDGKDVPALLRCPAGRNERAAPLRRPDHHHAVGEGADQAVADGKVPGVGPHAGGIFGDQTAALRRLGKEGRVFPGIDEIRAAAQDPDHRAAGLQSPFGALGVHALCHAGDHQAAAGGDLKAQAAGQRQAVGVGFPGPHEADQGPVLPGEAPLVIEYPGGVPLESEAGGIDRVRPGQHPDARFIAALQHGPGRAQVLVQQALPHRWHDPCPFQGFGVGGIEFRRGAEVPQKLPEPPRPQARPLGEPDPV